MTAGLLGRQARRSPFPGRPASRQAGWRALSAVLPAGNAVGRPVPARQVQRPFHRMVLGAAMVVVLVGAAAGCSSSGPTAPKGAAATVVLEHVAFNPPVVTIHAGQTVAWLWEDQGIAHDVTFDAGFHSPLQSSGVWTHTFDHPGTYPYRCTQHLEMTGEVVVLP